MTLRSVLWLPLALSLAACSTGSSTPPTATPAPSDTPAPPTATAFPTFTPTPVISEGQAIVVGGDLRVRSAPTTQSEVIGTLKDRAPVTIVETVQGENWLVGAQAWVPTSPDWTRTWFRLNDGSFVYAAFVFILPAGRGIAADRCRRRRTLDRRQRHDADRLRDDRGYRHLHGSGVDRLTRISKPTGLAPSRVRRTSTR